VTAPDVPRMRWFLERMGAEAGLALVGAGCEQVIGAVAASILRPGSVVVDGGCNAGLHAIPFAELVRPHGRVHAIDAHAATIDHFRGWAAQSWLGRVIHFRHAALWVTQGRAKLKVVPGSFAHNSLRMPNEGAHVEEEVPLERLDDLLPRTRVDFVKLDIEGAEFPALRGARRLLAESRCPVVFENGRATDAAAFGYSREDFFACFAELDYVLHDAMGAPFGPAEWDDPDTPWYLWAWPRGWDREAEILGVIDAFWAARRAELSS